jgi:hypothetical protein
MSRVTRSSAVWLLSTLSFGLESTRTSPNDSSSRIVAWKPTEAAAASMMNALVSTPAGVPARLPKRLTPLAPRRILDQSMPR